MPVNFNKWYPQFPYNNKDEKRAAEILFAIILAVLISYLIVILVSLYRHDWELIWFGLGGIVLLVVPIGMLFRGYLRLSSLIAILGVLGTVTLMATIGQGMHDIAIMAFPVIIIISSLMLDQRIFFFVSFFTIVAAGWLVFGEVFGWFIPHPLEITNWVDFLMILAILLVAIMAMKLLATNARNNLEQAQREIVERMSTEEKLHQTQAVVENANKELQQAYDRELHNSRIDMLTGVNNRRYLFELAEHEFKVAARYYHPLSVIMFDIDHFKSVNDTYGHAVGDQLLVQVAKVASDQMRSADVFGRIGGEEFIIVLPATTASQAYPVAERIRTSIGAIMVETDKGPSAVTISIGIAEMLLLKSTKNLVGDVSIENIIQRADDAMYAAKAKGRNQTLIFSPVEPPEEET